MGDHHEVPEDKVIDQLALGIVWMIGLISVAALLWWLL